MGEYLQQVGYLKFQDTKALGPITLKNPDKTVRDLTGTGVTLFIKLSTGAYLSRPMTIVNPPGIDGKVTYVPVSTDWDIGSGGTGTKDDPYTIGGLILSPVPPLTSTDVQHQMEYEVLVGSSRVTYPDNGYDVLRIYDDLGQG